MADERKEPIKPMDQVIREDGRYPREAYEFLNAGQARAVKQAHGDKGDLPPGQRHVTGQQICHALRELALERWGLLARTVLARWNLHSTMDFGHMIYLLIRHGLMGRTEEDSLEDFQDVYDFDEALAGADHFELTE